eukprot:scaffold781_cov394-Prasinococcus_capsulatus_cf.AAC.4
MSVVGRIRHLPYIPLSLMKLPKAGDAELVFKTVPKTSKVSSTTACLRSLMDRLRPQDPLAVQGLDIISYLR